MKADLNFIKNKSRIHYFMAFIAVACLSLSCSKKDAVDPAISDELSDDAKRQRPNIVFVLIDDLGFEYPSYTGGQTYSTPALDSLANKGRTYNYCFANALCSPSRLELMTGKYNNRNYQGWGVMPENELTIQKHLGNNGYKTCMVGKYQFNQTHEQIVTSGFRNYCILEHYNEQENKPKYYKDPVIITDGVKATKTGEYSEDVYFNYFKNFVDTVKGPFYCYYSMQLIHEPFQPSPSHPAYASWVNRPPLTEDTIYMPSMVQYVDYTLSRLAGYLNQEKFKNTIIVITSDNGGTHKVYSRWRGMDVKGEKGYGSYFGMHVPLIISGLGRGIDNSLVDFTDFFPQLCTWAKIPTPQGLDGTRLLANNRQHGFNYFRPQSPDSVKLTLMAFDRDYVKYDSLDAYPASRKNDLYEWSSDYFLKTVLPLNTEPNRTIANTLNGVIEAKR
jgi:arylsulfatase A